jgi:hypothetical protein
VKLNFLEPSVPLLACNGTVLPFTHHKLYTFFCRFLLLPPRRFTYFPQYTSC